MQKLELLYENIVAIYRAESGFSVLGRQKKLPKNSLAEPGFCLIFYPKAFEPDKTFGKKAESFCLRTRAKLLWIENPEKPYIAWNCITAADRGGLSITFGIYQICFGRLCEERDDALVFAGSFGVQTQPGFAVEQPGLVLDLSGRQGRLSFSFCGNGEVFSALDAGIRFYLPFPEKNVQEKSGQGGNVQSEQVRDAAPEFYSRVFCYQNTGIFRAVITPSMLWEDTDTYISIPDGTYESDILSQTGPVCLVPEDARLVLERTASVISYDKKRSCYTGTGCSCRFGIAGSFAAGQDAASGIYPGLSGTEYICPKHTLVFVPHQNALLAEGACPDLVTTSWIRFEGSYYCSSESMPFFAEEKSKNGGSYLRPWISRAADFLEESPAVPVMFWNNARFFRPDGAREAEEWIYKKRYQQLTARQYPSGETGGENILTAVASCGICVGADADTGRWAWIGIAQTSADPLPNVRLSSLTGQAETALKKKDPVLLIPDVSQFASLCTEKNQIVLAADGWEIVLSEEYWDTEKTLLLLKYSSAVSIRELLEDTMQLQNLLSEAYEEDGTVKQGYEELFRVIDSREFQGTFLLSAAALPEDVPKEAAAAAAGIKAGGIRAVYTIIERSRVRQTPDGQIKVEQSELSSLFSYHGESIVNQEGTQRMFDCRTVGLTAVVKQNQIRSFYSRMELLMAQWMGAQLVPVYPQNGKCLVLTGMLTAIEGRPVYQFGLEGTAVFEMKDAPITQVCFEQVSMAGGKNTEFLLSGTLFFEETEGCDLFSYETLPFAGMKLVRTKDAVCPDYGGIRFVQGAGTLRRASFAESFGAVIVQGMFERKEESPDKLDFFSITAPVKQAVMDSGWNGLVWNLSLGSAGELGGAGELSFEMITAWSHKKYYIGLRFQGAFRKSFSLQGIIGAGFSGIELKKGEENTLYFLVHGLTLKLLGLSFPKNGTTLLILGREGKTAWYAGYQEEEKDAEC